MQLYLTRRVTQSSFQDLYSRDVDHIYINYYRRVWKGGKHDGVVDPPVCPQLIGEEVVGEEDCLVLNIHTPASRFIQKGKLC